MFIEDRTLKIALLAILAINLQQLALHKYRTRFAGSGLVFLRHFSHFHIRKFLACPVVPVFLR